MSPQQDLETPRRSLSLPLNVLLFGVGLPVAGSLLTSLLIPGWAWSNIPFHATVEAAGGFLALVLMGVLLSSRTIALQHYLWMAAGLAAMGILDLGHAAVLPGSTFVWLHSIATLLGGGFFALVWLPSRTTESLRSHLVVPAAITLAIAIVISSMIFPQFIPSMSTDGDFSAIARSLNILGGLGFLAAGTWFFRRHENAREREDGHFAFLSILFGLAGVLFDYSTLWDAAWWWWHLLRLAAYGLVFSFAVFAFRRALQDQLLAELELSKSEDVFSSIVNSSPMGIYTYQVEDRDRLILVAANPAADRLTGIDNSQLFGKTIEEAFPRLVDTEIPDRYRRAALNGESWFTEQVSYDHEGVTGAFEVHAFQMSPGKAAVMFNEITDRKRAEQALEEQKVVLERTNEELKIRNAELDEFTYVASHDLQEPLRKMTSFCGLLEKDIGSDLSDRAKTDIGFITDAARRMQRLIQDLLALSRAGRSAMKREEISLEECVDRAIEALGTTIAEKGPAITRDPLPMIWGDSTLITQLFQNLIGNALKFTPPDRTPTIHISAEEEDQIPVFGVRDNGIGIEEKFLQQIFIPFKRLHGPAEYDGSGIGLAICRKAMERHGGRMWVESEAGKGSHFKFTLDQRMEERQ